MVAAARSIRITVPMHTRIQDGRAFACQSLDRILADGIRVSLPENSRRVEAGSSSWSRDPG